MKKKKAYLNLGSLIITLFFFITSCVPQTVPNTNSLQNLPAPRLSSNPNTPDVKMPEIDLSKIKADNPFNIKLAPGNTLTEIVTDSSWTWVDSQNNIKAVVVENNLQNTVQIPNTTTGQQVKPIWSVINSPNSQYPGTATCGNCTYVFNRTINLPAGSTIVTAKIAIQADDSLQAFVNGSFIGQVYGSYTTFTIPSNLLHSGSNIISLHGYNSPIVSPYEAYNFASVAAKLSIELSNGSSGTIPQLVTAFPAPIPQRLSPAFDNVPPANEPKVPGEVSVIYRNDAKIRQSGGFNTKSAPDGNNGHGNDPGKCDSSNPGNSKPDCQRDPDTSSSKKVTITSANPEYAMALNKILKKYHIQFASDGGAPGETEAKMDEDLRIVSEKVDGEVPHKLSIQFYTFPKNSDTNAISAELRQLSFVRTAYPSVVIKPQGNFELKGQTTVANDVKYNGTFIEGTRRAASSLLPNDPKFKNSEEDDWWWFNRYHVFQGWDFYTWALRKTSLDDLSLPKPKIAVIDSGFDINPSTNPFKYNDRPEYEGGMLIEQNRSGLIIPTLVKPDLSNLNIVEQTSADYEDKNISHGSLIASVLASPRNNNKNSSGIIPGAKIYPVKIKFAKNIITKEASLFLALLFTTTFEPKLDAINISLALTYLPVNFVPTVGAAIIYATILNNTPVVLAAGNSKIDLNKFKPYTSECNKFGYPACLNYGQITVGGETRDGLLWDDPGSYGSNYGLGVDMVAGAKSISGSSFDIITGIPNYYTSLSGSSLAAPMVTATLGMMKKISAGRFSALDLNFMVANTGTVSRAEIKKPEDKFLGIFLNSELTNQGQIARMRELNVYNALVMTYYLSNVSPYVVRLFNTDGKTKATINEEWAARVYTDEGGGNDSFWVHDATLSETDKLSFITNATGKTETFGYQLYNFKNHTITERLLGVKARYRAYPPGTQLYPNVSKDGIVKDSNGYILDPTFPNKACCNIVLKY